MAHQRAATLPAGTKSPVPGDRSLGDAGASRSGWCLFGFFWSSFFVIVFWFAGFLDLSMFSKILRFEAKDQNMLYNVI